jgi:hypothetical protein
MPFYFMIMTDCVKIMDGYGFNVVNIRRIIEYYLEKT